MAATTDFTDAAEKYAAGDVLHWWTSGTTGIGTNDYTPQLAAMSNPNTLRIGGLTANPARMVIMRIKCTGTPGSTVNLLTFQLGTNTACTLSINASNQLLWRDAGGGALSTAGPTTALDTTNFVVLEAGVLLSATVGRVELRLNGTQVAAATSTALGGSVSNSINTSGGFANCDSITLNAAGLACLVDFFITRTATAVWTTPGDWFADSTANPPLKKKTMQLLAGSAGNGQWEAGGTTFSIGSEPPGGTSQTDAIRTLPFPGTDAAGTGFITIVDSATHNGTDDRDSLILEAPPTDINSIKTVSHVWSTRYTNAAYGHKPMIVRQAGPNQGSGEGSSYNALLTYSGFTWCNDTCPTDGANAAWTVAHLTGLELGQHNLTVS